MDTVSNTFAHINDMGLTPSIICSASYWISIQLFQPTKQQEKLIKEKKKNGGQGNKLFEHSFLNYFIFIHNLLLCIFSFACFINTFPIFVSLIWNKGWGQGICAIKGESANMSVTGYGYWSYLFMLSKYYEVIDTYIVIAKGRRPINLQIYHHIGAMIGCSWFHYDKSVGSFIFMVPNAFVHSIMYFYYALSVLKIKIPFKSLITSLQMIQFIFGHCCIIYNMTMLYPDCLTDSEWYCSIYHFIYIRYVFVI